MNNTKIKTLTFIAFITSIIIVLSFIEEHLISMGNGGSILLWIITLIIAVDVGYRHKHLGNSKIEFIVSTYILCGSIILSLFIMGKMSHINGILGLIFDYLLPYLTIALLSPLFMLKLPLKQAFIGLIACLIIFTSYVLSGVIVWQIAFIGSITYNGTFMLPTLLITVAGLVKYQYGRWYK